MTTTTETTPSPPPATELSAVFRSTLMPAQVLDLRQLWGDVFVSCNRHNVSEEVWRVVETTIDALEAATQPLTH